MNGPPLFGLDLSQVHPHFHSCAECQTVLLSIQSSLNRIEKLQMGTISNLSDLTNAVQADTDAEQSIATALVSLQTETTTALADFKAAISANSATIPAGVLTQLTTNADAFQKLATQLGAINSTIAAADPGSPAAATPAGTTGTTTPVAPAAPVTAPTPTPTVKS